MKQFPGLTLALVLTASPVLADTVTIGTVQTYDPDEFTVDPEALQRFDRSLGDALCERANLSCEWSVLAIDELIPALIAGEIDVVMAALHADAELSEGVDTTVPYLYPDPFVIVAFPGTQTITGMTSVSAVPDPAIAAWHATSGYRIEYFPTPEEALQAVVDGRVDSVIGERSDLLPLVEATGGLVTVINENDRLRGGVIMALRDEDLDLRFAFEDQIYDMTLDGSLNAMTDEWFGIDAADW